MFSIREESARFFKKHFLRARYITGIVQGAKDS